MRVTSSLFVLALLGGIAGLESCVTDNPAAYDGILGPQREPSEEPSSGGTAGSGGTMGGSAPTTGGSAPTTGGTTGEGGMGDGGQPQGGTAGSGGSTVN